MNRTARGLVAVALATLVTLAGCSNDPADTTRTETEATASATPTSTPSAKQASDTADPEGTKTRSAAVDEFCDGKAPSTGAAVKVFGKKALDDAHCEIVEFVYKNAAHYDLVSADVDSLQARQFDFAKERMTTGMAAEWDKEVATLVNEGASTEARQKAFFRVAAITIGPVGESGYEFVEGQPTFRGGEFSPFQTGVVTVDDVPHLMVKFTHTTDLMLAKEGDPSKQAKKPITRTIEYRLARTGAEDPTWLIDDASVDFSYEDAQPLA